jgi:hypothetical protein
MSGGNFHANVDFGLVWLILCWIGCMVAGGCAGSGKRATVAGVVLGAILGPLGVIAALGIDGREHCPRCAGKADGEGNVCQHCGLPLLWNERWGKPYADKRGLQDESE